MSTDKMQTIAGKINSAFSALELSETFEQVLVGDSMSSIAGKMQRNFAKITNDAGIKQVAEADSMSSIAQKLKDNFDLVEQIDPEPSIGDTFSFLHISDPHGTSKAYNQMISVLNGDSGCEFGLVSGDLKAYGRNAVGYSGKTNTGKPPILAVTGNHDAYDSWSSSDVQFRTSYKMAQWMYDYMGNEVVFGDTRLLDNKPISAYWYKDFALAGGNKLRLIGIDQYELVNAIMKASSGQFEPNTNNAYSYNQVFTSEQFDWLVARLKELSSTDHVLITLHQSPFTDNSYYSSIKPTEPYLENGALRQPSLLWCSELMEEYPFRGEGLTDYQSVICEVMKAYMTSGTFSETRSNGSVGGGYSTGAFSVAADFTNNEPAKFWGYVFGHLHEDLCTFIPSTSYPKQLLLGITCSDNGIGWTDHDDLLVDGRTYDYRINKITLMLNDGKVMVERIGQQTTKGGRTRQKIVFDIDNGTVLSTNDNTITQ